MGRVRDEDLCLSFDCGSGLNRFAEPERVFSPYGRHQTSRGTERDLRHRWASGTQIWLQPNRYYDIDRLQAEVDDTIKLENVLLVKDGKGTTLGQPYVKDATVSLKVMAHRRGPKVIVYKMRPKKKTRRKNGHRQELTRVMVESISVGGKAIS